ncbi:DUF2924 domain-containing protein [bacterium]|nr:DUF2924 domain-containing protein [bacterium]
MTQSMERQIEELGDMSAAELREQYREVFGEETRSRHKGFLRKRITWRLQANAEGGLSERARRRAAELADEADLRLLAPVSRGLASRRAPSRDRRLPMPGTVLMREYRGRKVAVTVLDVGFEHGGTVYRSLTAVARAITGTHWNGYHFFGLGGKGGKP